MKKHKKERLNFQKHGEQEKQKNSHGGSRNGAGRKKGSKKLTEPIQTTVTIEKKHKIFLKQKNLILSEIVRKHLDFLILDSSV